VFKVVVRMVVHSTVMLMLLHNLWQIIVACV